jgi:hypothetical protein
MKENGKQDFGIYLIGSLRNENVPVLAKELREALGIEVFDDWFSPGPKADDFWRDYEHVRGSTYKQALHNYAGTHVFEFDHFHIDRLPMGILYMPAGKSGHLELGYMIGRGKRTYILFDKEPERWDVMYQFTFLNGGDVFFDKNELIDELKRVVPEMKKEVVKVTTRQSGRQIENY